MGNIMVLHDDIFYNIVDDAFSRFAVWEWKFAWLPKKCEITSKTIWLHYAYRGKVVMMNNDRIMVRWRTTESHLWKLMKK